MSSVKKPARFAVILPLLALVAGCGGSSDNVRTSVTPRYVPVTLAVQWQALPTGTRLVTVPANALSAAVRLTDLSKSPALDSDLVTVATVNRDTGNRGAYKQTFTTKGVAARANRETVAQVQFFTERDGKGAQIGVITKRTNLPGNGDLGDFNAATAIPQN